MEGRFMRLRSACVLVFAMSCGLVAPAGAQVCAHDICIAGGPLNASCDPCVADICQADSFCCEYDWDKFCIEKVATICGLTDCTAACVHSLCEVGEPLDATCNRCATSVCEMDPVCCNSQWDANCVALVDTACGFVSCTQGADDCGDAVVVDNSTPRARMLGTLIGASPDGCSNADVNCGIEDVWYSYTVSPTASELLFVNTCGTEFSNGIDTVLSVHTGCPGNRQSEVFSNDDWMFGPNSDGCVGSFPRLFLDSATPIPLEPGNNFKIRISRFNESPSGPFQVYIPEPSSALLRCVGLATVFALSRWRLRRRGRAASG
jgi:hypothetical protein